MASSDYLEQLKADQSGSATQSFIHVSRLIAEEIDRVEKGTKYIEVHNDKTMKLQEKVLVPIKEHPKFNFVGKLLGPQGNSLKRLQAETGTKMSILGKGSMREKKKEDELRKAEDPKYSHLNEDLHVLVEVFAPPADAHSRMAHALCELKKFLVPDFHDEIRQQQFEELMYLNGDEASGAGGAPRGRGRGRGVPPPGVPRGRGGAALLATPPGRGGPASRGGMAPPGRGAAAPRGAPAPRGARGAPSGRGGPLGRPAAPAPAPAAPQGYSEEEYGYGQGYEDQSYGYTEEYRDPYEQEYSSGPRPTNGHNPSVGSGDSQYFDYGHGVGGSGRESGYSDGGYSGDQWGQNSTGYKTPGTFKAPSRGKADFRSHPYAGSATRGGRF